MQLFWYVSIFIQDKQIHCHVLPVSLQRPAEIPGFSNTAVQFITI